MIDIKERVKLLNERLAGYIPPSESWTPAEEAVFKPADILRVPIDEAQTTQFKAIKYTFSRHYAFNHFYRTYCQKWGVTPDDIKTYDDLEKIPLIPDLTFKQHPSGADFAHWIANVYTGELPRVVINTPHPTIDDVIDAFNAAGLAVAFSSGTSGRHTVIPRDTRTYLTAQYLMGKMEVCVSDAITADHCLALGPSPAQSNAWVAKGPAFQSDMYRDVLHGLDFDREADTTRKVPTDGEQRESASVEKRGEKTIEKAIKWLEQYDKTTDTIRLFSLPFLIYDIIDALEQQGKRFEFGERGTVVTGGGWKMSEFKRISSTDFRKRIDETLGIPETRYFDYYGMVEISGSCITCSEGHYFHLPYTYLKPLVIDRNLEPAGYDEWGRFAFLDGLPGSYPGFILTGDLVRMRERCPACDRPGPVLEQSVQRAPSEEIRGCTEVVLQILQQDSK
jgi:long-chain-fatty-acid---luciferin-component ligase